MAPPIFIFAKSILEGDIKSSNICPFIHTDSKQDTPRLHQFDPSLKKEIHAVCTRVWPNLRQEDKQCPLKENINQYYLSSGESPLIKVAGCVHPPADRLT